MKEQKDIKQDFDRWLLNQWKEGRYVPKAQDRMLLLQKLRFRKFRRNLGIGLTIGIIFLLAFLLKQNATKEKGRASSLEKHTSTQVNKVNPWKQSKTNGRNLKEPVLVFQAVNPNQKMLIPPMEQMEILTLPQEEHLTFSKDPVDRSIAVKVDLDTVMKNLGIFYMQSATSNNGHDFAGITSGHELVLATVVDGSYSLPRTPDTMSTEGAFRPLGMAGNQFVQYSFFDARPLLFNEAIYRQVVAINVLPRIAYYLRNTTPGWSNPINNQMNLDVPQVRSNAQRNQDQYMRRINGSKSNRSSYMRQGVRVYQKANVGLLVGDNFLVKSQGEKVLVVSCDAERVSVVQQNGVIEASHSISIQQPRYFSQKARYPFYDETSRRLYLIVETNFSFLWYEVNQLTGEARYIFKTETIWNNPNWHIENGQLSYEFKGKKIVQSLN